MPILAIFKTTKAFVVKINANGKEIASILLQDGKPIAFESKKLNHAHQNYSTYNHELFSIVHALKQWCHYLYGASFEIIFDYESIKWFTNQTNLKGRKARWVEFFQ